MNRCCRFLITLISCLCICPVGTGQPDGKPVRVLGTSDQTKTRLREAEQELQAGTAGIAVELQTLIDEVGDDLVSLDGTRYQPARLLAQQLLSRLPGNSLRVYRDRADLQARRLLEEGRKSRDPSPLIQIVDRYFVSRSAEEAVLLLGELAFERGEFLLATQYWRLLWKDEENESTGLRFPDPTTNQAQLLAQMGLASFLGGDLSQAQVYTDRLIEKHADAEGRLAGQTGKLSQILGEWLRRPAPKLSIPTRDGVWPTFAGDYTRSGRVNGRIPKYLPSQPTWQSSIPNRHGQTRLPNSIYAPKPDDAGYFPVVLGDYAYVADQLRIYSFELKTGRRRLAYDFSREIDLGLLANVLEVDSDHKPATTLTVADGQLYARMGTATVSSKLPSSRQKKELPVVFLACFTPKRKQPNELDLKWKLPPPATAGSVVSWQGTPVVKDGRIYAMLSRFEGDRVIQELLAYSDPPRSPLWRTELCEAPSTAALEKSRPELLAESNGILVACSHAGVVTAVDSRSGKPIWAYRYPSIPVPPDMQTRDLSPPVIDQGRVFVAPADADRVFAFNLLTGELIWRSSPVQVDQLLGVAKGRVIISLNKPTRGIRALNIANGSHREPDGWACHDDPFLRSFGRGLLTEDLIFWPTWSTEGTFILRTDDGTRASALSLSGAQGNFAFAGGVILVAGPTELSGYVADRLFLEERRAAIQVDRPAGSTALFDLARALDDTGESAKAEKIFAQLGWRNDLDSIGYLSVARQTTKRPDLSGESSDLPHSVETVKEFSFRLPTNPTHQSRLLKRSGLGSDCVLSDPLEFPSPFFVSLKPLADREELPGLESELRLADQKLVVTDGRQLCAYKPGQTGRAEPKWQTVIPEGLILTHGAVAGNNLIMVGSNGAAAVRLKDGQLLWTKPIVAELQAKSNSGSSTNFPLSTGLIDAELTLNNFVAAGSHLVARLGEHALLGIQINTGELSWVLDSSGRSDFRQVPFPTAPRFHPNIGTDGKLIVVQLNDGNRWHLDAETGRLVVSGSTSLIPWQNAPPHAGDREMLISDGPGALRAVDSRTGNSRWKYDFRGTASLSGMPPTTRPFGSHIIAAVYRNHGVELESFQTQTGTLSWTPRRNLLPVSTVDLRLADADDKKLYIPADGKLTSFFIDDGQQAWQIDLNAASGQAKSVQETERHWKVWAGRKLVFAHMIQARPEDDPSDMARRFWQRGRFFGLMNRLPRLAMAMYYSWTEQRAVLLMVNPESGAVVGNLSFSSFSPIISAQFFPDSELVVTTGRAYWLKPSQ